mmetsp:Transcript_37311/g.105270  ORF Transcript_37311/g.105270 Transcript_37311/m.105270 type:complete len:203 (+) Transcript_37311:3728-4336(+)
MRCRKQDHVVRTLPACACYGPVPGSGRPASHRDTGCRRPGCPCRRGCQRRRAQSCCRQNCRLAAEAGRRRADPGGCRCAFAPGPAPCLHHGGAACACCAYNCYVSLCHRASSFSSWTLSWIKWWPKSPSYSPTHQAAGYLPRPPAGPHRARCCIRCCPPHSRCSTGNTLAVAQPAAVRGPGPRLSQAQGGGSWRKPSLQERG